ncbi:MAG: RsmB/NOP family class I SAM-dependent RNA methyltransferase [Candidatus Aenigmarchaeota archaeon]|nr:RsmB/NOP family class I SAM-dependent RNA methyltransferase [Candidatus Aenigmarchaeota archaeon]
MSSTIFINRYKQLGEQIREVGLQDSLRMNILVIKEEELLDRFKTLGVKVEKIPFARFGYWIKHSPFSLGATTEYLRGYYYLQEAAAQLPVQVLDPLPNETVLDMCAAPGGKTTQIAQAMFNTGTLVALEKKQHRLIGLLTNLERMRVRNAAVFHMDGRDVKQLGLTFDRILLDAPCSGNYMTDRQWFEKRTIKDIETSAKFQRDLLKAALEVLKPNGVLVYSTCSLEPEENELNMQWLLENYKVQLEKIHINIGDEGLIDVFGKELDASIRNCRRFWPHKTNTEGFFIAKVRQW